MARDDERLRRFLNDAHRALDPEPPSFEATLAAARLQGEGRGRSPRPRWRLAAVAAVTMAIAGIVVFRPFEDRPVSLDPAAALQLAESLSEWHGPTDFLARPPGVRLLETFPRLDLSTAITSPPTEPSATREPIAAGGKEDTP